MPVNAALTSQKEAQVNIQQRESRTISVINTNVVIQLLWRKKTKTVLNIEGKQQDS